MTTQQVHPFPWPGARHWVLAGFALLGLGRGFAATELTLDPHTGVIPRVISPNSDQRNDVVFFALENPRLSDVSGKIFDASGAEVADLVPSVVPTVDSLIWDGRDRGGNVVPAGLYFFEITGEGKVISGAVAVAR